MNFAQIRETDVANGPGIRVSMFLSGCHFHCRGCFNKEYQDFDYGSKINDSTIEHLITSLNKPYITGLSILGGEPLDQNLDDMYNLIYRLKSKMDTRNQDIWLWTGHTWESIIYSSEKKRIISLVDVIVDGQFIEELKNLNLTFRGSSNQRIIDVKQSIVNVGGDKIIGKEEPVILKSFI